MPSWVRYGVSAYLGLLLAGSIASPGVGPQAEEPLTAAYQQFTPLPVQSVPVMDQQTIPSDQHADRTES